MVVLFYCIMCTTILPMTYNFAASLSSYEASYFFRKEIGVFFCGPSVLSHVLHKMANQYSDPSNGVKFSYNKENF